jgi:hypothetical protein
MTTNLLSLLPTLVIVGVMVFFVWWMRMLRSRGPSPQPPAPSPRPGVPPADSQGPPGP